MLKLDDILNIFDKEKKINLSCKIPFKGLSIDTRTLKAGEVFLALKGPHFDGHSFLDEAFKKGAVAAIVRWDKITSLLKKKSYALIGVNDTQVALEKIARVMREKFKGRVIAVTGSNGKTTTKEMIAHILSSNFNVLKNTGTQNNHIGVPLTISRLKDNHQLITFELGASKRGEILFLKEITRPDFGLITNIGQTHLEFLKTKEEVLATKLELFLDGSHRVKVAFLNFDDEDLKKASSSLKCQVISFGRCKECQYRANNITQDKERISFTINRRYKINLNTIGEHNVYNALAAWALTNHLGIAPQVIQERLSTFIFPSHRLNVIKIKDLFVIDDTYNANPQSVKAAFKALSSFKKAQKRIACLADMLELGEASEKLHYEIGFEAARLGIDIVVTFGQFSKFLYRGVLKGKGTNCVIKETKSEVLKWLLENVKPKQAVLFKGSRAMKMEELVRCFIDSYTN